MNKESKLTDLMALMVLLVFALCIMMVLLMGTRVYQRLLDKGAVSFTDRMSVRYVTTRVRQAEAVSVEDFEGCSALVIPETVDGEVYNTLVYWYDGYICEMYCEEGAKLYPEDGEKVIETEEMRFCVEGDLLTAEVGDRQLKLHIPVLKEAGA